MSKPIKMYVIAGEASGDLHASNLMHALIEEHDAIDFKFARYNPSLYVP